MKQSKIIICMAAIFGSAAVLYAGSTEEAKSLANGLHVGGKTTDRVGFYDATPVAQQATTVTAQKALMVNGMIAGGTSGADFSLQHLTVPLSAANLIAMYATPVVIVPAKGAGHSVIVTRLDFTITRSSTAFTGGGAVIFQYGTTANGAGTQALDSTLASTVITGAAGMTMSWRNGAVISDSASTVTDNVGLYISNATAAFAAGTGTATVDVWFVVH